MAKQCLCIDVGGSFIKYALIDGRRTLTGRGKLPTPYDGVEAYLHSLESIYRKFEGQVCGIALSVPGIIDSEAGVCRTAGALRYADGLELVRELEQRCGVPVTVMNDAKCAALAEATWGALAGCKNGIVIVLGTGIGGALIQDGKVHLGSHFAAGEFSPILLNETNPGFESSWAFACGNPNLRKMAAEVRGADPDTISGEDIFGWINAGDEAMLQMLDRFTAPIAYMIANLQLIFDPERFAIGGGISQQPKLLESIQKNLDRYSIPAQKCGMPKAEITACRYFNDANLLGAYSNFLQMQKEKSGTAPC